jgi:dihydrofolate reductase
MSTIATALSVSLDGFIAGPGAGAAAGLHVWLQPVRPPAGSAPPSRWPGPERISSTRASPQTGAVIAGRRTYDVSEVGEDEARYPACPW